MSKLDRPPDNSWYADVTFELDFLVISSLMILGTGVAVFAAVSWLLGLGQGSGIVELLGK